MKAIVVSEPGGPEVLKIEERPDPVVGPGLVRVGVRATALNRADLLQRRGRYPAPPDCPPDIPGLEFAGEVLEAGPGVTEWSTGDRVMGLLGGGGYATQLVTHERLLLRIPGELPYIHAAAIPEAFLTAYDALFRQVDLAMGETLLIHAVASGVGTAGLQLAKAAGVRVVGTSRSRHKLAKLDAFGLDVGIDTSGGGFLEAMEAAGFRKVDAIMDLIGAANWEENLRALRPLGRLIVVGVVSGAKVEADLGVILRKRLRLLGTVLRARPLEEKGALTQEFAERVLPLFEQRVLHPVVDEVFPFGKVAEAHAAMEENRNTGKIVLEVED